MKKLKLFIVLALLPAVIIGCEDSDPKKEAKKANQNVAQAQVIINKVYADKSSAIYRLNSATDEELKTLRSDLAQAVYHVREAILIDDKNTDVKWGSRDDAGAILVNLSQHLKLVDEEIARREAKKATPKKAS